MNTNVAKIESTVQVTLAPDTVPSEEEVASLVTRLRSVFPITDEEEAVLLKRLHQRMAIRMETGTALVARDHRPWVNARKPDIEPFYYDRFEKHLFMEPDPWPRPVVTTLDSVTDEILDLCGNPAESNPWRRRGLVMGGVQSGKTATYTGLSCKAADAGYRLIILLTGTQENLRRQTQERLDAGFVGLDSSGFLARERQNRALGVGLIDQSRTGVVFTSRTGDFNTQTVNRLNFRLNSFHEPILLVVKKNKRILQNLENWLRDFNADGDGRIGTPLLLLDDEADHASVNTNSSDVDPTAINERIRALLALFRRATYIGFTATPFANIFIDPDTEHEMLGDDLFPRDFIYALEAPTNYVGPEKIFDDGPLANSLRDIDDASSIFPHGHKSALKVESLPDSLIDAVGCFIITNSIRDLRREGSTHRSMLVNVSRFNDVQIQVADLLAEKVKAIQNDIRNYSRLSQKEALQNPSLKWLKDLFHAEYSNSEFSWRDIQRASRDAALPIVVRAVNQRTGTTALDYAANKENGLRIVAVGGNSLSRGLTLEGLSTSYFLRNSQMYDTLLQMGRWFGYRDSYVDLCRIWLSEEAQHWYSHITQATAELREEIRRMKSLNLTPQEFGLKVRAHPDALIVTARNKMRTAQIVERVISLSNQSLETPHIGSGSENTRVNAALIAEFLTDLESRSVHSPSPYGSNTLVWKNIPKEQISQLLRRFQAHPRNVTFQGDHLAEFLDHTRVSSLSQWDVAVPGGEAASIDVGNLRIIPQKRTVTVEDESSILVAGKSARVASRGAEREGMDPDDVKQIELRYRRDNPDKKNVPDWEYRKKRARPLLLVHYIRTQLKKEDGSIQVLFSDREPLIALGLSFPPFEDNSPEQRVKYQVNLIEWRSLFSAEVDDDEEVDDNAA
jgi:hypothetical protein